MREAEELCDRIAFIKGGRILAEGSADELKRQIRIGDVIALRLDPRGAAPASPSCPASCTLQARGDRIDCTVDSAEKRLPEILPLARRAGRARPRLPGARARSRGGLR